MQVSLLILLTGLLSSKPGTLAPVSLSSARSFEASALYQRKPPRKRRKQRAPKRPRVVDALVAPGEFGTFPPPNTDGVGPHLPTQNIPDTSSAQKLREQKDDPTFVPPSYDGNELARRVRYPDIARNNGIEGRVVLHARVDTAGRAVQTIVHRSDNKVFDDAATKAVQGVRFSPGQRSGVAVESWVEIIITFKLAD